MNKVILMETGETPSLGPSCCFARLILSFALCQFSIQRCHYRNVKVTTQVYKPCLSFFISFSLSGLSHSFHRLSLSSHTSSTPQHSQSAHATYETLNSLSIVFYRSHSPYETMTDFSQCGARSGLPQ